MFLTELEHPNELSWIGNFSKTIEDLDPQLNESAISELSLGNSLGLYYSGVVEKVNLF